MEKATTSFRSYLILLSVFLFFLLCWVFLNLFVPADNKLFDYFTDTYGLISALGASYGFMASKKWGGYKSAMGKSVGLLSVGLLFQFFGQVSYATYYYVFHIENAYPSIGDFFYFGSIPLYIAAIAELYKVLQMGKFVNSIFRWLVAIIIPAVFLTGSYLMFLKDYEVVQEAGITNLVATLLDFGYPLGAAVFLGLTVLAYIFSRSALGGKLKKDILFLFVGLVMQYIADAVYLSNTINESWRPGGLDDLFYLISYAMMGFTLITIGKSAEKISAYAHDRAASSTTAI
jgi:hypothetical protein